MTDNLTTESKLPEQYRPPGLVHRSTSSLPQFSGMLKEYYFPFRWLGYTAAVLADIYVDHRANLHKEGKIPAFDKKAEINRFARWETGLFAGITLGYAIRDAKDGMRHFREALGAEYGKVPAAVTFGDMQRSQNPIIQKAVGRYKVMQAVRFAGDLAFLKNLNWGLLGMAARITLERTVFNKKTAYERLEFLFDNTQLYGFDNFAPEKAAKEFANILQQCQKDHRREPWDPEVVQHYMPLFRSMGEGTVNKEMNISEATYLIGELLNKRLTLPEAMELCSIVRDKGLGDVHQWKPAADGGSIEADAPKKMTSEKFAQKYLSNNILSQDALTRGQRSFSEMAKSNSLVAQQL